MQLHPRQKESFYTGHQAACQTCVHYADAAANVALSMAQEANAAGTFGVGGFIGGSHPADLAQQLPVLLPAPHRNRF